MKMGLISWPCIKSFKSSCINWKHWTIMINSRDHFYFLFNTYWYSSKVTLLGSCRVNCSHIYGHTSTHFDDECSPNDDPSSSLYFVVIFNGIFCCLATLYSISSGLDHLIVFVTLSAKCVIPSIWLKVIITISVASIWLKSITISVDQYIANDTLEVKYQLFFEKIR